MTTPKKPAKKAPAKKKRGRPEFQFTDVDLAKIELLAGFGTPVPDIAKEIGCSDRTLQRRCKEQLEMGKARANAKVAGKLFANCMKGKETSIIWWEKTRSGMSDKMDVNHGGTVEFVIYESERNL